MTWLEFAQVSLVIAELMSLAVAIRALIKKRYPVALAFSIGTVVLGQVFRLFR